MKTKNQNAVVARLSAAPPCSAAEGAFVFILSILLYAHRGFSGGALPRCCSYQTFYGRLLAGSALGRRPLQLAHTYVGPVLLAAFAIMVHTRARFLTR